MCSLSSFPPRLQLLNMNIDSDVQDQMVNSMYIHLSVQQLIKLMAVWSIANIHWHPN